MALTRDPVCGMMVDPAAAAAHRDHAGTTYHFCSPHCAKRFEADAGRFLSPKPGGLPMSGGAAGMESMASPTGGMGTMQAAAPADSTDWKAYVPLLAVFAMLLLATLVLAARDAAEDGAVSPEASIARFMAGFFLVFAGFKLMDLPGFAAGYSTYDLLASRVPAYGYLYPFIELGFGLAMLSGYHGAPLLWAEIGVMGFSGVGVALKLAKREPFQCACLGTFLKVPLTKVTLVEDFGMAALAAVLLAL